MSMTFINKDFHQQIDSSIQKLLDDIADVEFIKPQRGYLHPHFIIYYARSSANFLILALTDDFSTGILV